MRAARGVRPRKEYFPDRGWYWICPCGAVLGRDRRRPQLETCNNGHRWRLLYARWTRISTARLEIDRRLLT